MPTLPSSFFPPSPAHAIMYVLRVVSAAEHGLKPPGIEPQPTELVSAPWKLVVLDSMETSTMLLASLTKSQDKFLVCIRPHLAAGTAWNEAVATLDDMARRGSDVRKLPKGKGKDKRKKDDDDG